MTPALNIRNDVSLATFAATRRGKCPPNGPRASRARSRFVASCCAALPVALPHGLNPPSLKSEPPVARLFNAYVLVDWSAASQPGTGAALVRVGVLTRAVRFR